MMITIKESIKRTINNTWKKGIDSSPFLVAEELLDTLSSGIVEFTCHNQEEFEEDLEWVNCSKIFCRFFYKYDSQSSPVYLGTGNCIVSNYRRDWHNHVRPAISM